MPGAGPLPELDGCGEGGRAGGDSPVYLRLGKAGSVRYLREALEGVRGGGHHVSTACRAIRRSSLSGIHVRRPSLATLTLPAAISAYSQERTMLRRRHASSTECSSGFPSPKERRVGKACGSTSRTQWSPSTVKIKNTSY